MANQGPVTPLGKAAYLFATIVLVCLAFDCWGDGFHVGTVLFGGGAFLTSLFVTR